MKLSFSKTADLRTVTFKKTSWQVFFSEFVIFSTAVIYRTSVDGYFCQFGLGYRKFSPKSYFS